MMIERIWVKRKTTMCEFRVRLMRNNQNILETIVFNKIDVKTMKINGRLREELHTGKRINSPGRNKDPKCVHNKE